MNQHYLIHEVAGKKIRHRFNSEIGDAIECANTAEDRIVEQHVDAAPFSHDSGGQSGNRRNIDEIHGNDERALTTFFDFLRRALETSRNCKRGFFTNRVRFGNAITFAHRARAYDNIETSFSERKRSSPTDSSTRTRDNGDWRTTHDRLPRSSPCGTPEPTRQELLDVSHAFSVNEQEAGRPMTAPCPRS